MNFSDPFGLFRLEGAAAQQFVRDLQSGARTNLDEPRNYSRCEVGGLLRDYIAHIRSNALQYALAARGSGFPGKFDWKYEEGSTFEVDGMTLRGDQFGNFAAGYAFTTVFGAAGYTGARAGGVAYAVSGRSEHWSDRESVPMIDLGYERAQSERGVPANLGSYMEPVLVSRPNRPSLTSTQGCP